MTAAETFELDRLLQAVAGGDSAAVEDASNRVRAMALADLSGALDLSARFIDVTPPASPSRVRAMSARAHALCYANDFEPAIQLLTEARELAEAGRFAAELGPLWLTQVQPLARLGRLPDAEHAARSARASFLAVGAAVPAAKAGVNLGIVLRMMGRPGDALECFTDALPHLFAEPLARGMVESNRAEALLDLDRFDDAARTFETALEVLNSGNHDHAAAVVEGNLADLLSRRGDIDASLPRFDNASARFERVGASADAARLLAEEAEALLTAGALRKCVRLFDRALPALRQSRLTRETARACLGAGIALLKLGDHNAAAEFLEEAAATAEVCGAGPLLAEARLALAEAALAAGRTDEAHRLASAVLECSQDRPLFRARVIATLATIAMKQGDDPRVLTLIDEGLRFSRELHAAPLAARFNHLKALSLAHRGDHQAAHAAFRAAIEHAERRRTAIRAEQLRTAFLESAEQLYHDAVSTALDDSTPESIREALRVAELIKARTLLENRTAADAGNSDSDCTECLSRLNTLYSRLGPNVRQSGPDQSETHARLVELEAQLDRLHDRRATEVSTERETTHATIDAWRKRLPAKCAAVVYLTDRDAVSAIVVTASQTTLHRHLATRREITQLARRIGFDIERSLAHPAAATAASDATLARVADMLVRPLLPSFDGSDRVSLVPCRELHALPVTAATLHASPGGTTSFTLAPGFGVGLRLAELPRRTPRRALIIGVADELAPLAEEEARDVARHWPDATLLTGKDASVDAVMPSLASADLVHFAGHGIFDPDFPMSSRLRLGDRWVTAREFTGRFNPGVVVVMSGCDTGQSAGGGEDRYGLTRACLSSGASAVVGSLWRLSDSFARSAFVELHARFSASSACDSASLAHALTSVQREHAANRTPWPLWAGLYLKGAIL